MPARAAPGIRILFFFFFFFDNVNAKICVVDKMCVFMASFGKIIIIVIVIIIIITTKA
jgi:hypothetical protein